ncbi:interleukin-6 receptor subunit alpha isoform X2 [Xenopus laevis]|uniref:Interleukin-6 receptor subunit alpha isoform X2 n=1 Tax=Xenopus laevis TaxID=8355 RepID=A0A8J0TQQ4_XENLA|nr:interleukin-6 receptor subunit alpha isoform X2 [Xenopus laevis]
MGVLGAKCRTLCLLMLLLQLLVSAHIHQSLCPKPVLPPHSQVALLLSNVSLTCPGCEGDVLWRRGKAESFLPKRMMKEGRLLLNSIQSKDGNLYTCIKEKQSVCSVELLVAEELEKPEMECYLRHPASNITCEWKNNSSLPHGTKVTLISSVRYRAQPKISSCSYFTLSKKYQCLLHYTEGNKKNYFLSLCVSSQTDSTISNIIMVNYISILQPDPPMEVTVSPIEFAPRKLRVTWQKPLSWSGNYYQLLYEVQYWAENSQHVSSVMTSKCILHIVDAFKGRRHCVRVRAIEEFEGSGSWSSWSQEANGTPWTDSAQKEPTTETSQEVPGNFYTNLYPNSPGMESGEDSGIPISPSRPPWYTFVIGGVSLGFIFLLVLVVLLRKRYWTLLKAAPEVDNLYSKGD